MKKSLDIRFDALGLHYCELEDGEPVSEYRTIWTQDDAHCTADQALQALKLQYGLREPPKPRMKITGVYTPPPAATEEGSTDDEA